jgi:diguanylate cyclase (GGDEF)-like protein
MLRFDLRTVVFMSMLLTFILSMLLAITRAHHKDVRGPAYWAVGNLVIGLGMVLVLMQLDAQSAFIPGMAFIGAGLALQINGTQAFLGRQPNHFIPMGIFATLLLIDLYFMYNLHDVRTTAVLGAITFSGIYLFCARQTFLREEGVLGNLYWVVSSIFLLMATLMAVRAIYVLNVDPSLLASFATWPVNTYLFMFAAVSQFFVATLFVLALSYRLTRNLTAIATIDSLTNVLNRRGLEEASGQMKDICKRINLNLAALLIDIDFFKKVNDDHGHLVGDDVLRLVANQMTNILRSSDALGRYGGEEFCAFLPNTSEQDALALAERIRAAVENAHFKVGRKNIKITVSIGVVDSVQVGYEFSALMTSADKALYHAKSTGRNRVVASSMLMTEYPVEKLKKVVIH